MEDIGNEFDLEGYIDNYKGNTKITRLYFIAQQSERLRADALQMLLFELKKTTNTSFYKSVVEAFRPILGPDYHADDNWVAQVDARSARMLDRLELELNGYKTNLIKESIRMGYNDLGDFHQERGDLNNALKCFVRTREYLTTPKHIVAMCLNVIKVSIEMENYTNVLNYVSKAEQTPVLQDPIVLAKLKCCTGLAQLHNSKFKIAARKFLETSFELGSNFSEVIAPQDVAVYGGLCALAQFDRRELKERVLDNSSFRQFLELVPQVRELINDFYNSRYASCLSYLEALKPALLLDIHLHTHVETLFDLIRSRALVQYYSPFSSVNLTKMADAFNTDVNSLEKELVQLISAGQIRARIDSQAKILYSRSDNTRNTTFRKGFDMTDDYLWRTRAMLLRASLQRHEVAVRPSREEMDGEGMGFFRPDGRGMMPGMRHGQGGPFGRSAMGFMEHVGSRFLNV